MSFVDTTSPLVSVIIPAYNSEQVIIEAIESVIYQTFENWELIVIDDGSTDRTHAVILENYQQASKVSIWTKPNGGASSARNFGVSKSNPNSKYLFFHDADDCLKPEALEIMVQHLEQNPDVGLLGCQLFRIGLDGETVWPDTRTRVAPGKIFPRYLKDDEYETPFEVFFCATGQGPSALFRRSVFEKTEGWDENLWGHNDTDMFIQMSLEAPVHYIPNRLYFKRIVETSLTWKSGRSEVYEKLRSKWNQKVYSDPRKMEMLKRARIYYYRWFRPLRYLSWSKEAASVFINSPNVKSATKVFELWKLCISELFSRNLLGRNPEID